MSESKCEARVEFLCMCKEYDEKKKCKYFIDDHGGCCMHYFSRFGYRSFGYCGRKEAKDEALNELNKSNKEDGYERTKN